LGTTTVLLAVQGKKPNSLHPGCLAASRLKEVLQKDHFLVTSSVLLQRRYTLETGKKPLSEADPTSPSFRAARVRQGAGAALVAAAGCAAPAPSSRPTASAVGPPCPPVTLSRA